LPPQLAGAPRPQQWTTGAVTFTRLDRSLAVSTELWIAFGFALIGQACLTFDLSLPVGAILLAMALGVAARVAVRAPTFPKPRPLGRPEALGLVVLFVIALALRLYRNADFPPSVFYDEAFTGLEALHLPSLPAIELWSPQLSGRPTLQMYLLSIAFHLFGVGVPTLRGVSAVGGALTVLFTSLAAGEVVGERGMWLTGAIMAVSRWDLTFSRIAYAAIWAVVFAGATIWLLAGGTRRGRASWLIVAGVPFGLGLYTYVAFRLFAIAVGAFWLLLLWQRRRAVLGSAIGFAIVGLIVAGPILGFGVTHPDQFTQRFSEVTILRDVQTQHSLRPLLDSATLYLGIFNYRGGIGARHNLPLTIPSVPGTPELGFPYAVCFVLGFGLLLAQIRRPANLLLAITLVVGLAAGALTILAESPQPTRAILAVPVTAIAAAATIDRLLEYLPIGLTEPRFARWGIAGASLVAIAAVELVTYDRQATFVAAYHEFRHEFADEGSYLQSRIGGDAIYLSDQLRRFPATGVVDFLVYPNQIDALPLYDPATTVPAPDRGRPVVYALNLAQMAVGIPYLQQFYPTGVAVTHFNPAGEAEFSTFDVSAEAIDRSHGISAVYQGAGQVVDRTETTIDAAANPSPLTPPFDVQWHGTIVVADWGNYVFQAGPSGQVSILIDGLDGTRGERLPLASGPHSLAVRATVASPDSFQLRWARDGGASVPVPADSLFTVSTPNYGLEARYYLHEADSRPLAVERVPGLNVIPPDQTFQRAVWHANILAPVAGRYQFWLEGDDYATLTIDGHPVASTRGQPAGSVVPGQVDLSSGANSFDLELVNLAGAYSVGLEWQPPNGERETVPAAAFRPIQGPYN
jgi:4-amino-4-deoxy-L-arabinose transferase-like glycosyltransferase